MRSDRDKNGKRKQCNSGGVCILFKNELMKGITKLSCNNPDMLWIKLCKTFFGLTNDWFLCGTYIVPINSPHFHVKNDSDVLDVLQSDVEMYSTQG